MLGTIVNTSCIIIGSIAGSLIKKGIKPEIQKVMFTAMGLASLGLGVNAFCAHFSESTFPVLFIISLAVGGLFGTWIDIDARFKNLVDRRSAGQDNSADGKAKGGLAQGLSTCILLFCIGTFSIVGPMNSALYGDNTFLFTNATLDLITSCVFATTYGIGIIFAAPVLFCWQGMFYLIAKLAGGVIPDALIHELISVGGLLIVASGLSLLELKDCKSLNLLPSLLVPVLYFFIQGLF
ncbi:MAG: DUF554 domain-containing protein [Bacteroidales bacterium]|nr:DUF554 domain-containing protein [Bacteroidales bacterium]